MADTVIRPNAPIETQEGFLHYLAREGRYILRWVIGACLIAIVICMVTIWFAAVVPAVILMAAYVLLLLAREVERRSDKESDEYFERTEVAVAGDVIEDHTDDDQLAPPQAELVKRESKTGLMIMIAIMMAAAMIAFILFDLKLLAIGAFVVFAYMLFIGAPLWLGWFNDDIEDETRRMEGLPESASVKTQ